MSVEADLNYGVEPVKVGNVSITLDVFGLADELFAENKGKVEDGATWTDEVKIVAKIANEVLGKHGFPKIESDMAAYQLSTAICVRALDLKKAVGDLWRTKDAPESPDSTGVDFEPIG